MMVMSLHFLPFDARFTYSSVISGKLKPLHFSTLSSLPEVSLHKFQAPLAVIIETSPGAVGSALDTIFRERLLKSDLAFHTVSRTLSTIHSEEVIHF